MMIVSGFGLILEFGNREESHVLGRSWYRKREVFEGNLVGHRYCSGFSR